MRNLFFIFLSSILLTGCNKSVEDNFKDFDDYVIADFVNTEFPNGFVVSPWSYFGFNNKSHDNSDAFFFINNIDDYTELFTNSGFGIVQPIDFESQTLVGYFSVLLAKSQFVEYSYDIKKDSKKNTFQINKILTNYGSKSNSSNLLHSIHWFIFPKIEDISQIEFNKKQINKGIADFDISCLTNRFSGGLKNLKYNSVTLDVVFNINPLDGIFPILKVSSSIDGELIEFSINSIFKHHDKIELYNIEPAYGTPLIVSDYFMRSGLYFMETKELAIEFENRDGPYRDDYQTWIYAGNMVETP